MVTAERLFLGKKLVHLSIEQSKVSLVSRQKLPFAELFKIAQYSQ